MAPADPPAITTLLSPKQASRIITSNPSRFHLLMANDVLPPLTKMTSASSIQDCMCDVDGAWDTTSSDITLTPLSEYHEVCFIRFSGKSYDAVPR